MTTAHDYGLQRSSGNGQPTSATASWAPRLVPRRVSQPVATAPATSAAETATDDWDLMFNAVRARLLALVAGAPAGLLLPTAAARETVADCVDSLERLHALQIEARDRARPGAPAVTTFTTPDALPQADQSELLLLRAELATARELERQSQHRSRHDDLTGLPNRRLLRERLEEALAPGAARPTSLALLFIDLDSFKPINDRHGHAFGDAVLRVVAVRLQHALRTADMVSRIGSDEFVCLLHDMPDRSRLRPLAAALVESIAAPVLIDKHVVSVQASIGMAMYPEDGATAEALLHRADASMFDAKRQRRGRSR